MKEIPLKMNRTKKKSITIKFKSPSFYEENTFMKKSSRIFARFFVGQFFLISTYYMPKTNAL